MHRCPHLSSCNIIHPEAPQSWPHHNPTTRSTQRKLHRKREGYPHRAGSGGGWGVVTSVTGRRYTSAEGSWGRARMTHSATRQADVPAQNAAARSTLTHGASASRAAPSVPRQPTVAAAARAAESRRPVPCSARPECAASGTMLRSGLHGPTRLPRRRGANSNPRLSSCRLHFKTQCRGEVEGGSGRCACTHVWAA